MLKSVKIKYKKLKNGLRLALTLAYFGLFRISNLAVPTLNSKTKKSKAARTIKNWVEDWWSKATLIKPAGYACR